MSQQLYSFAHVTWTDSVQEPVKRSVNTEHILKGRIARDIVNVLACCDVRGPSLPIQGEVGARRKGRLALCRHESALGQSVAADVILRGVPHPAGHAGGPDAAAVRSLRFA